MYGEYFRSLRLFYSEHIEECFGFTMIYAICLSMNKMSNRSLLEKQQENFLQHIEPNWYNLLIFLVISLIMVEKFIQYRISVIYLCVFSSNEVSQ